MQQSKWMLDGVLDENTFISDCEVVNHVDGPLYKNQFPRILNHLCSLLTRRKSPEFNL